MSRRILLAHIAALSMVAGTGVVLGDVRESTGADAVSDDAPRSQTLQVNGATLHYVRAGEGAPLVLIHGFPQDWSEFRAIIPRLAGKFTVIAVDLRGIGGSAATAGGYDAANMAEDVHQLLTALDLQRAYVVGHDLGGLVTYALVRRHPQALRGAMIVDVPIPGLDGWDEAIGDPGAWHVRFMQVPDLPEKLVDGNQAAYFHYFFSSFGKFTPADEASFVSAYSTPAQLHAVFEMYRAFPENVRFNQAQQEPNDVPVLFAAGERSPFAKLAPRIVAAMRDAALTHVESERIPGSMHYVVQDQPERVADLIERRAAAGP